MKRRMLRDLPCVQYADLEWALSVRADRAWRVQILNSKRYGTACITRNSRWRKHGPKINAEAAAANLWSPAGESPGPVAISEVDDTDLFGLR